MISLCLISIIITIHHLISNTIQHNTMKARVPRVKSSGYQLFGMTISEKSWTYWLAGQLLVSGGFHSAVPALSGLLAGNMYDKDYCSIQTLRFPRPIEVHLDNYFFHDFVCLCLCLCQCLSCFIFCSFALHLFVHIVSNRMTW